MFFIRTNFLQKSIIDTQVRTFQLLMFTVVLLGHMSKASQNVTSCLVCSSTTDTSGNHEDPECVAGKGKGNFHKHFELNLNLKPGSLCNEADGCVVFVSTTDAMGSKPAVTFWLRDCCMSDPGRGLGACTDIHDDTDYIGNSGSTDQTWWLSQLAFPPKPFDIQVQHRQLQHDGPKELNEACIKHHKH